MGDRKTQDTVTAAGNVAINLLVRETKDVPPALSQIIGLAFVLCYYLRPIVPIETITKDHKPPNGNEEVYDPSLVHRYLLLERDTLFTKQIRNLDLDTGALMQGLYVNYVAGIRAIISLLAGGHTRPAGVFVESNPAGAAHAFHLRLPLRMVLATPKLTTVFPDAGLRAKLSLRLVMIEGRTAQFARVIILSWGRWIAARGKVIALVRTVFSSTPNIAGQHFFKLAAKCAGDIRSSIARVSLALWKCHLRLIIRSIRTISNPYILEIR
jgi:hypothetical protein